MSDNKQHVLKMSTAEAAVLHNHLATYLKAAVPAAKKLTAPESEERVTEDTVTEQQMEFIATVSVFIDMIKEIRSLLESDETLEEAPL